MILLAGGTKRTQRADIARARSIGEITIPKRAKDYRGRLLRKLNDPGVAAAYLNEAIADSEGAFLTALRNVAEAHRIAKVAEVAGIRRESLYRSLSERGNPRLDTLLSVLRVLQLRMAFDSARPHLSRRAHRRSR